MSNHPKPSNAFQSQHRDKHQLKCPVMALNMQIHTYKITCSYKYCIPSTSLNTSESKCVRVVSCKHMLSHARCSLMPFFRSHVATLQKRDRLSVQQTAPLKTSCAPIPQGATRSLGLQPHGRENHGLKFAASKPPREML